MRQIHSAERIQRKQVHTARVAQQMSMWDCQDDGRQHGLVQVGRQGKYGLGTHIANGLVLTCAHVVVGTADEPDSANSEVISVGGFGAEEFLFANKDPRKKRVVAVKKAYTCQGNENLDLAVLRLGHQIEYFRPSVSIGAQQWESAEQQTLEALKMPSLFPFVELEAEVAIGATLQVHTSSAVVTVTVKSVAKECGHKVYMVQETETANQSGSSLQPGHSGAPVFSGTGLTAILVGKEKNKVAAAVSETPSVQAADAADDSDATAAALDACATAPSASVGQPFKHIAPAPAATAPLLDTTAPSPPVALSAEATANEGTDLFMLVSVEPFLEKVRIELAESEFFTTYCAKVAVDGPIHDDTPALFHLG